MKANKVKVPQYSEYCAPQASVHFKRGQTHSKKFQEGGKYKYKGGKPIVESQLLWGGGGGGGGGGEAYPEINLNIAPLAQLKLIVMARALQPYNIIPMISIMVIEQLKHQTKKCAKQSLEKE